jgi:hypothetical protein
MASKKKAKSKKSKIRDLPKKKLTDKQAKTVKGGHAYIHLSP